MWRGRAARQAVRQEFLTKKLTKFAGKRVQTLVTTPPDAKERKTGTEPRYEFSYAV